MAKGPRYRVPYRRRREGKTDYKARRAFILSKRPRVVTRGSLKHMNVQIVEAEVRGDNVVAHANSRELVTAYGWKAYCGNVSAAYLTGFLCGLRAASKGVKTAVPDIGLHLPSKGSRIFAALKGVLDGGVTFSHDEEKFPEQSRIEGKHVSEYAEQVASDSDVYKQMFSRYLTRKLPPEKLPEHFSKTKEKIEKAFKPGKPEKPGKREKPEKPKAKAKKPGKKGEKTEKTEKVKKTVKTVKKKVERKTKAGVKKTAGRRKRSSG